MKIERICVVGGGFMGRQIALCAAIHGICATVYDISEELCQNIRDWEEEYLAGRIAKGRMTEEEVAATKERFSVFSSLEQAVEGVQCVIECVPEDFALKCKVLRQISDAIGDDVLIATNTSYIVSSRFADCVRNPQNLCNAHFYSPTLVMKAVEVVQGPHTAEETAGAVYDLCQRMGKTPIWQKKEIPGFAGNYLFTGLRLRAEYLVENGYCTPQEVDMILENAFNHKMGVFRTMDLSGAIIHRYNAKKREYDATGEKPDMFDYYEDLVKQGRLGRKTKHGFYDYE